jgi:hypothetical protein
MQEVANDQQALAQGSRIREQLKAAQEFNTQLLDREDKALKERLAKL